MTNIARSPEPQFEQGAIWLSQAAAVAPTGQNKKKKGCLAFFLGGVSISYPAASPLQPRGQTLSDKLPHAVHDGVDHGWVAVPYTVHRQGPRHRVQGDHLPPGHTLGRQETGPSEEK